MVNVECIGSDLLVQHYELVEHSKSHVKFYSAEEGAAFARHIERPFAS